LQESIFKEFSGESTKALLPVPHVGLRQSLKLFFLGLLPDLEIMQQFSRIEFLREHCVETGVSFGKIGGNQNSYRSANCITRGWVSRLV
jgi:hypothetical protein